MSFAVFLIAGDNDAWHSPLSCFLDNGPHSLHFIFIIRKKRLRRHCHVNESHNNGRNKNNTHEKNSIVMKYTHRWHALAPAIVVEIFELKNLKVLLSVSYRKQWSLLQNFQVL